MNTYTPSGNIPSSALVAIPATAAIASLITAPLYILAVWYIPIIYLNIFMPIAWAFVIAFCVNKVVHSYKVRNPLRAGLLAIAGAVVGYLVSWLFWVDLIVNISDTLGIESSSNSIGVAMSWFHWEDFITMIKKPALVFDVIQTVYHEGHFSIKKMLVTGPFLGLIWLIEAVLFFFYILTFVKSHAKRPFSERANDWIPPFHFGFLLKMPEDKDACSACLATLSAGDVSYLTTTEKVEKQKKKEELGLKITLYPSLYDDENFITIDYIFMADKNKKQTKNVTTYLSISAQTARELKEKFL